METEPVSQVLSISKRGRQLQELPALDNSEVSTPPQKGLNLRPLLRTIQRKALLVIGITGAVSVGAFVWASKNIPTSYKGDFQVLVEPVTNEGKFVQPSRLTREGGQGPGQEISNLDYATQLEILKSPRILHAIHEQIRDRYPKLLYFPFSKGLTIERLASEKSPEPTKILKVGYEAEDPKQVEFVLKVAAEKYLQYSLQERKTRISEGVKFIDDQLPELNGRVETLQSQLQRLQQQNRLTDPKTQGDQLFTQVRDLTTQQAQTQRDLAEQKTLYASLQKQLELTPSEAIAASALSEDPNYRVLQAKVQEIDNKIAEERSRFQDDNPVIQSLLAKRQSLLDLQGKESNRIVGQNITDTTGNPKVEAFQNSVRIGLIQKLVEATNQIELLEVRNQALAQTKRSIERQAQQFPSIAREYNAIQEQLDIANRTREQLLTQRETLRVEAAQKQVPWELVSKPQLVSDPKGNPIPNSKAKPIKIAGVLVGLLLGVGTAAGIERIRNIFYNDKELEEGIPLPLLGIIPVYKGSKRAHSVPAFVGSVEGTEGSYPNDPEFQKAFDSLYASIRFLFNDPPVRSLAVGSAGPFDGKSTVALNLAQTAASMGQRVLLVDANLRQPQLHERLGLSNQKGLCDLLAKTLAPNELIQKSAVDNLSVLTSGQPQRNSTKLLGSAQMQYLMEEFQATFDLVIYDTAQFGSFMDTNFLAAHTDGILMVVAVGKTKRTLVMQVLDQLNTYRLPTLGVVANHLKRNTNIPYETGAAPEWNQRVDELPAHQPAGKWLNFNPDNFNETKSS